MSVGDAEPSPVGAVDEATERDEPRDRVAPVARTGHAGRVREPADRPRFELQAAGPVQDRAALAAFAAVVAGGPDGGAPRLRRAALAALRVLTSAAHDGKWS